MRYICTETWNGEARCWKREGHGGQHMTVLKNRDQGVPTRPEVVRWSASEPSRGS